MLLGIFGWYFLFGETKETEYMDLRLGVLTDSNIQMINVSPERRMINLVAISGDREVWIPGGLSWYKSDRIKKILIQERQENRAKQILFYNFGFVAEDVIFRPEWNGEIGNGELIKYWGLKGWLNYRLNSGNWMLKKEIVDVGDDGEKLDEIMPRDMAETLLVNQDTRLIVGNVSEQNGLGSFVTKSLERSGLTVMDILSVEGDLNKECEIRSGVISDKNRIMEKWLSDIFSECVRANDAQLNDDEIEIYFGRHWAEMINYQSYVRTF